MQEILFEVQGSAPEPYKVIFVRRSERNLSAYCSCPAGEKRQYCKHRFNILAGITEKIVSGNEADAKTVQSWLPGTDIEQAIHRVQELEMEAEKINRMLSVAKKAIAKTMND